MSYVDVENINDEFFVNAERTLDSSFESPSNIYFKVFYNKNFCKIKFFKGSGNGLGRMQQQISPANDGSSMFALNQLDAVISRPLRTF